jgi:L-iditol 2-dehydrogenase
MTTMRAAVLRGWNDLAVTEVDRPVPGHGEILVKVSACGLCGTDLKMVHGKFQERGWPPGLPFIIGHEWSGTVAEIGPGVTRTDLAVGDRVVAENHVGCGACSNCRTGRYNLCMQAANKEFKLYGHTAPGALAEYAVRPEVMLHKISEEIGPIAGALVNQGALTVHAMRRVAFAPGSTAVVFGPGLLGLLSTAVAKASGAARVIMVGRGERLKLASRMGADELVDYEAEDPVAGVRSRTDGGRGADYAFDCTGNVDVVGQALGSVRRGGKVALLGLTGGKTAPVSPDKLTLDEIDLLGVRSSPNAYPAMIRLLESGAVDVSPLLTHVYPLDRVAEAFASLESREAIRPIVEL